MPEHGNDLKKQRYPAWLPLAICLGLLACMVAIITYFYPPTSDDYFYMYGYGKSYLDQNGFLKMVEWEYTHLNGRILGNILVSVILPHKLLSICFTTCILVCMVYFISKYLDIKPRILPVLAAVVLVYCLPQQMYRQVYAWMAGFYNYVPVMLLLLIYLYIIQNLFQGKAVKQSWKTAVLVFFIGFAMQLFVENMTIYAVVMSIAVVIWHWVTQHKKSWTTISFSIGTILGAAAMYLSPIYGGILNNEDSYRKVASGLKDTILLAVKNYVNISNWGIAQNHLLTILLCLLGLFIVCRGAADKTWKKWMKACDGIIFAVVPLYFYFVTDVLAPSGFQLTRSPKVILLDMMVLALFIFALLSSAYLFIQCKKTRNQVVFFTLSAVTASASLLVVTPLSARCLYGSYILLVIVTLSMANYVYHTTVKNFDPRTILIPISALVLLIFASYGFIHLKNTQALHEAEQYIQTQMAENQPSELTVPLLPYNDFVHDHAVFKDQFRYQNGEPLEFKYVPYSQWKSSIGK